MGKLIMTADDSASVRQMVAFTLKQNGYDVIESVDGRNALTKLAAQKVDMLITDLNMPNLDGIGLIKGVRSGSLNKFIPIIMLTTESQDALKSEAKAAGATGWIVKPFKPEQLIAVIRKVLAR
ncbi:MAG: response regulator [Desulfurivibrio sp.]|jgi:two-component system chemotaxis response regulator CheY|nr:MAG: response regulator [Desulfurivibrio sp.]